MTEINRVKITDLIESQIPEFLNSESPLFKSFLNQYYISMESQGGSIDLATNIKKYKDISYFTNENLNSHTTLVSDVLTFDSTISVESTVGWPSKYGLLKIDDEIITYKSKTDTTFEGCIRGFSGIDQIKSTNYYEFLTFKSTEATEHTSDTLVYNLSNLFLVEFFEKYKSEFLPGFELRNLNENLSLENFLSRSRDFYASKGTEASYEILFKILYGKDIKFITPKDYILRPSANFYLTTKNILVEKISGGDPLLTKGNFLYQQVSGIGTASASIFNVEYRPIGTKNLYEVSLDSNSIVGNFRVSGRTKLMESAKAGDTTLIVDSTIGFSNSGTIIVEDQNSNYINLNYTDKTNNQFLGVTGLTIDLEFGKELKEENFAYTFIGVGNTSKVELRIINVIEDIDFSSTSNMRVGDKIQLSGFGRDLTDNYQFNTWIYNLPTKHNIKTIVKQDDTKYRITLFDSVSFIKGEQILLEDISGKTVSATILTVEFDTGDSIKKFSNRILVQVTESNFSQNNTVSVNKVINKSSHQLNYFPNINLIPSGIQNTYIDNDNKYFYVTSSGLPNYQIFSTDTKKNVSVVGTAKTSILNVPNHKFVTGESVYYAPKSETVSGISTGTYFVTSVDTDTLRLSYSKSDLYSKKYIEVNPGVTQDTIYKFGYQNKTVKHQKLLKKFFIQNDFQVFDDKNKRSTNNRQVGLLVNGVELLSPTLFDENCYYGNITSIEVISSGKDYDVINAPELQILDESGSGAKAFANIVGSVREIKVVSPGIGYQTKPKITISGGNGSGCVLESNLVKSRISVGFKPETSLDLSNNTITFNSNHNFDEGEEVIYNSKGNLSINGLVSGSRYYVGIVSDKIIKLYNNREDSINKVNELNIIGISSGFHSIETLDSKNTITKVYVKESGTGYSNRSIKVPSILSSNNVVGVNTFDSYFYATNHGFNDGEVVVYNTTGIPISGLSTTSSYHVKVLDKNRFKLAFAGVGDSLSKENYTKQKFVKFSSLGVGTHIVSYPPITIKIESLSSIGSTELTQPILKPIVLGSVSDVYIENGGVSYGSTNIINYHRRPFVGFSSVTSECILKPIIVNGIISDVKIINKGRGYRQDSKIIITGKGKFAEIEPIVVDGRISSVNVINGGYDYDQFTTLSVVNSGSDAKFLANVYEWKINQVEKSSDLIDSEDDGIFYPNKNTKLELQFINFFAPKKLRFQLSDNFNENNKEISGSKSHSPILGYAYDGCPIYGPYGYESQYGGTIKQIKSSYELKPELDTGLRPPGFKYGYFVNDYVYTGSGDLDEHNGRWCITPQFPNGTYAYFTSVKVDETNKSTPFYPYAVGNYFKFSPIVENFLPSFNQDTDISNLNISRNIGPYYINKNNSSYVLIDKVDENLKQEFNISEVKYSGISSAIIFNPGIDYQVDDRLILDNTDTSGTGANIVVSKVSGIEVKSFSVAENKFENIDFDIKSRKVTCFTSNPHGILNDEIVIISGISTITSSSLEGPRKVTVVNKSTELLEDIPNFSITGYSTYITVRDTSGFSSNEIIGIGTEILLVTNVSPELSRLYVNRLQNTGIHSVGIDSVTLLPNKFEFTLDDVAEDYTFGNYVTFFDPKETVGTGTTGVFRSIVGVNTTYQKFIPQKSIYLPNHKYYTGQPLVYDCGIGGTSLLVSNVSIGASFRLQRGQTVYAVNLGNDYIGLSTIGFTSTSGIGTTLNSLFFVDFTSNFSTIGYAHSLSTVNPRITGTVERFSGIVTTTSSHGLSENDSIDFNIENNKVLNVKLKYNASIRKVVTEGIVFTDASVNTINNSITINNTTLNNGDKVVYTSSSPISGLQNNGIYFVLKNDINTIQLCEYRSDVEDSKIIDFISVNLGTTHELSLINPPINYINRDSIKFDMSDSSLSDMYLKFYQDYEFIRDVELIGNTKLGFSIKRNGIPGSDGAYVELNTSNFNVPTTLYYNLISFSPSDERKLQISSDKEVLGANKLIPNSHLLVGTYKVSISDSDTFTFNLTKKPSDIEKSSYNSDKVSYVTSSKTAYGPISKLKINFAGRGYKKLPFVSRISSEKGKNAVIKLISPEIGKISKYERVKDGFDYPTDPTLSPYLSVPSVIGIKDIQTIERVGIITGGNNYNTPPVLLVKDNPEIKLSAEISGSTVTNVKILNNVTNLKKSLDIIPIYNSNGYDIDNIQVSGSNVTLELLNENYITSGYGSTEFAYPFAVGDEIFIEGCRLTAATKSQSNFNSSSYGYRTFTVTGISTLNNTVTYSMSGISTGTFGTYDNQFTLGYVCNKKDLASFEMILSDNVNYLSKENVTSDSFSGTIMENGWDGDLNQMRVSDSFGELEVGDKLLGNISKVEGTVEYVDKFKINSYLGTYRDKISPSGSEVGILNDFQQRTSDNFYYQQFSYSIKSEVPYSIWRESVRSIIHPSGFKEFSDLEVYTQATPNEVNVGISKSTNLKPIVASSDSKFLVNLDNEISMNQKDNFALVYEEDSLDDGSIERIYFDEGVALRDYIVNKTNKVVTIDDISNQFNGTSSQKLDRMFDDASNLLSFNRSFIQEEVVGFVTTNYPSILSNPDWNSATYKTNVGVLVDAISHDIKYQSNNKSVETGLSYWSGVGTSYVAGEVTETVAGFNYVVNIAKYVINNVAISTSYQNPNFAVPQQFNDSLPIDTDCSPNYSENCYVNVYTNISNLVGVVTAIVGLGTTLAPSITYPSLTRGGAVVGLTTFKLTNKGIPLFKREFDSTDTSVVDLVNNCFVLPNHNFQSGQELIYDHGSGNPIGIATTTFASGDLMFSVGNLQGTAIYENGIGGSAGVGGLGNAITTSITGVSTVLVPAGPSSKLFIGVPGFTTTGFGTGSKFNVLVTYSVGTGVAISTSINIQDGGRGYAVGQRVSISGTFFGGTTPTNDLSFIISKTAPSGIQTEANKTYSSVPSTDGKSTFDVTRDNDGYPSTVTVVNSGSGYALTSVVSISGTYLGGNALDIISFNPTQLAIKNLPRSVFVSKVDDNRFRVGVSSTSIFADLTSVGSGIHSLSYKNPNNSVLISIDGIIQSALRRKSLSVTLSSNVSTSSTDIISISSGISSLAVNDILNINSEYLLVKNIGLYGADKIGVQRGYLGTVSGIHTVGSSCTVLNGDFNIVGDVIYFTTAPYGKIGPVGLETGSNFSGRFFSRKFDPSNGDKNVIIDDISMSFTGIAATEFTLKVDGQPTTSLYNDINDSTNINNIPFILINNVFQNPSKDYLIDGDAENTIKFISGIPNSGKISKVAITTGFGYQPLLNASGRVVVSASGTISNIILTGPGGGYRQPPVVSVSSTIGTGASITANVGAGGTITSFTVVNAGSGYTSTSLPTLIVGFPTGYSNLGVAYTGGSSGVGQNAKVSVTVGQGSSIISFKIDNPGVGYKVGDILEVQGITTNPSIGSSFSPFRITVQEIQTDKFTGFYPGQFLIFDDISDRFNGVRKKFTLSVTRNGIKEILSLKVPDGSNLNITNNIFIYINDILQTPDVSYTFSGSRVIFKEAPKQNSTCSILYYRGSSLDVEEISPPKTIKEGDLVIIRENEKDLSDTDQLDRVVKSIISSDQLDTFTYSGVGIDTNPNKIRPATWIKQDSDRIINGSLYSKSRLNYKSNIKPTTRLIKSVNETDNSIYVDNAFPLFTDVDSLNENVRDIMLIEDRTVNTAICTAIVSSSSTITSISIVDGGSGYAYTSSPNVYISQSSIIRKDPIKDWKTSVGILTQYNPTGITYGNIIVSVGSSSRFIYSQDGSRWTSNIIGYGGTINFNSVSCGGTNSFFAVGDYSKIVKSIGYGNTLTSWEEISLVEEVVIPGLGVVSRVGTSYTGNFNDISYSPYTNSWVAVGSGGSVFTASGIQTSIFTSRFSSTIQNINSVSSDNTKFVAVGNNGTIISSVNSEVWELLISPTVQNLNKIISANGIFVAVGDNGTIIKSISPSEFTNVTNNITENIIDINYSNFYTLITASGKLYYSFDLENWVYRDINFNNLSNIISIPSIGYEGRYVVVGLGTAVYSDPVLNRATAIGNVTAGVVTSISITNGGFGYSQNKVPPVLVESDFCKTEVVRSIKVVGDYGTLIGINTFIPGTPGIGTTSPKVEFVLKSEKYDNSTLGIGYSSLNNYGVNYSQLTKGDYFVIFDSNVKVGHALTGITTAFGGMSNYPSSRVGTANSFIDGVYRVEDVVTNQVLGITTVSCNFAPIESPSGNYVQIYVRGENNSGVNTNGFYGRYSWSKIYDYQNRSIGNPKNFTVNTDNGLVGLSSSPQVTRTRGII